MASRPALKFTPQAPSLNVAIELVTPETAREMLTRNTRNRPASKERVLSYSKDMAAGRWRLNGEAVKFYSDGTLADGQHRLMAVIKAGCSVYMMVIRGLDVTDGTTLDLGKIRNMADMAGLLGLGVKVTKDHQSTANAMRLASHRGLKETPQEGLAFLAAHIQAVDFAILFAKSGPAKNACVRSVIARAWYTVDKSELIRFANVVATGEGDPVRDVAAIKLGRLILSDRTMLSGEVRRVGTILKVNAALQYFLAGRRIMLLREAQTDLFPLPSEGA